MDCTLSFQDRIRKVLGFLLGKSQYIECKPLGSFAAYTGKSCKLVCQILKRCRKILHSTSLEQAA